MKSEITAIDNFERQVVQFISKHGRQDIGGLGSVMMQMIDPELRKAIGKFGNFIINRPNIFSYKGKSVSLVSTPGIKALPAPPAIVLANSNSHTANCTVTSTVQNCISTKGNSYIIDDFERQVIEFICKNGPHTLERTASSMLTQFPKIRKHIGKFGKFIKKRPHIFNITKKGLITTVSLVSIPKINGVRTPPAPTLANSHFSMDPDANVTVTSTVQSGISTKGNTSSSGPRLVSKNESSLTLTDFHYDHNHSHEKFIQLTSNSTNSNDSEYNNTFQINGDDSLSNVSVHNYIGSSSKHPSTITDYFFNHDRKMTSIARTNKLLIGSRAFLNEYAHIDCGYFGKLCKRHDSVDSSNNQVKANAIDIDQFIYMNVSQPFCLVCVGVQGAGKSHTMNIVLENCLLGCNIPSSMPLTRLSLPMVGLVLHYDQSPSNVCEATGLYRLCDRVQGIHDFNSRDVCAVKRVVILVSPSYYHQRKKFYPSTFEVIPLLFKWSSLGAQQLKKLMRLSEKDSQLYVSVMLDQLRQYQRENCVPIFSDFIAHVKTLCTVNGQSGPLEQRLQLLQNVILESSANVSLSKFQASLEDLMNKETLIVADLTDPMLSSDEANGLFQVLLEQFRNKQMKGVGKVVAFDEAHKYLSSEGGKSKDELSTAIVNTVRLMRHEGIRVLISTQSPLALPSELLELVSITVAHHFQSINWYTYLSSKIVLLINGFDEIIKLNVGEALVVSTKIDTLQNSEIDEFDDNETCLRICVRPRITSDYGASNISNKY